MRKAYINSMDLESMKEHGKLYKTLKEAREAARNTNSPYVIAARGYNVYSHVFAGYVVANVENTRA